MSRGSDGRSARKARQPRRRRGRWLRQVNEFSAGGLVVDLAGPVRFVVEGDDLTALAAGWQPGRVGDRAVWIRPAGE